LTEKPPHTVTSFDSLNEKITIERIGMYKKAKPNTSEVSRNKERF
jgi:hypothetical protein